MKQLLVLVFLALVPLAGAESARAEIKVALVLDKGGKDDKSFNASAYKGLMEAKDKLKIGAKYVEATDDNSFEPMLRAFAQKDFDLIIAVGLAQEEALRKVAKAFPQKHFAIIDADPKVANVRALLFQEHEGSYLVGALAALTSKSGKVGFIGGVDMPLIRRFEMGYAAGARKVNPQIKIASNYVGSTSDAWNNPPKAKELAVAQYGDGADVVFAAAGASNAGLFDAAEEKGKLAIGVDSNQNWVKPGRVLTSMLKRVDVAVYKTIEDATRGDYSAGVKRYGLENEGVDYAMDQYNAKLVPDATRKKVDELKKQIIAGKIQVPDYYKTKR
jgi:basic membrane protein A